jgi:hypothetical protein
LNKYIDITVSTINGEILEKPKVMSFRCDGLYQVGVMNVREYDINDCIVVKKVFAFNYSMGVYGTTSFSDVSEFLAYKNTQCACCNDDQCGVQINNCFFTINGCLATINGN